MSFSQNSCQKVQFSTGTAEPITADIGILKFELECIYIYMQCIVESFVKQVFSLVFELANG